MDASGWHFTALAAEIQMCSGYESKHTPARHEVTKYKHYTRRSTVKLMSQCLMVGYLTTLQMRSLYSTEWQSGYESRIIWKDATVTHFKAYTRTCL